MKIHSRTCATHDGERCTCDANDHASVGYAYLIGVAIGDRLLTIAFRARQKLQRIRRRLFR